MKKKFKLSNLNCAHCASQMEEAINKINGVNNANISFMTQKLTIDVAEENFDSIMTKIIDTCKVIEPDCAIIL